MAVGEVDEEEPESGDVTDVGILNATMKEYDAFLKTLSSSGQLLVTILWKTHGGSFDDEFYMIAYAELANASYAFPWGNLFNPSSSPTKNNKPKDPAQQIGGLSLPLLRETCGAWIDSTHSQPSALGDKKAVGAEDEAFSTATKTNDLAFAEQRAETVAQLQELFDSKVTLTAVGVYTSQNLMQILRG